jgi:arylsulfatase A-like enzyme
MRRREFLGAASAAWPLAAQGSSPRPNIIFILADDLGYGDLGCYGQHRILTPNIDRLADEGLRFTQAYAGSTVCAPSRCTLMTGLHTGHAQVRGNGFEDQGMQPGPTLASVLKGAGYRTMLSGKWGLGGPMSKSMPNDAGFDEFFGFLNQMHAHNNFPEHLWENKREFFLKDNWFGRRKQFAPDLFTERALRFLAHPARDPYFLFLSYTVPHADNERGQIDPVGIDAPDLGPYAGESWPAVE